MGVMYGYPDGSFQPENKVNRAELAVILQRYDDLLAARFGAFMEAQSKFANNNSPQYLKQLIILAESGFRRLEDRPADLNQYSLIDNVETLPEGYSIYRMLEEGVPAYFVHYKGDRFEGDILLDNVEEWYGRFSRFAR